MFRDPPLGNGCSDPLRGDGRAFAWRLNDGGLGCIRNCSRSVPCFTRPSVPVIRSIAVFPPAYPVQILRQACLRLSCGILVVIADCKAEAICVAFLSS